MKIKQDATEKLEPFFGKRVLISYNHPVHKTATRYHYVIKPEDLDSDFFEELIDGFDGSEDEEGIEINLNNYIILSCEDGVEISESGELEYVQVGDLYALHKKTGKIIHLEDGIAHIAYNSIDEFVKDISINDEVE